jgi:hypothetical protein
MATLRREHPERVVKLSKEEMRTAQIRHTLKKLGMSLGDIPPQPKVCDVCGSDFRISLDHDHKTKRFRGWLCGNCNWALGHVKDNPETLEKLARYLGRYN